MELDKIILKHKGGQSIQDDELAYAIREIPKIAIMLGGVPEYRLVAADMYKILAQFESSMECRRKFDRKFVKV
jgi:hypothetical protein